MSSSYPLDIEVIAPERVARWRPLVNWLLVIPVYAWSVVLVYGAGPVAIAAWCAIVFSGRLPESLGNYLMAAFRYQWRTLAYLYGLTDRYPGFRPVAGYVDPGDYPAILYSSPPVSRRRSTVVFRAVLAIPQVVASSLVGVAAVAVLFVGWWVVLVTGRWPKSLRSFVVGWLRWTFRVNAYCYLLTDVYPPFGLHS